MKKQWVFYFLFFTLFCCSELMISCSSNGWVPQWSGSGFIKKEFLEYKKIAVLPFEGDPKGETSDIFAQSFHEKFPQIALLERKQLLGVFGEKDLHFNLSDETVRRKFEKDFGVQALIFGNVYYPSILRWLLQVQIVDVKTGEVMGRSLVEIDFMGAEGVKQACRIAVQNLTPK